jgi:hypothetical protein
VSSLLSGLYADKHHPFFFFFFSLSYLFMSLDDDFFYEGFTE